MTRCLLAWLGQTDLDASRDSESVGTGPIAGALAARAFERLVVLNTYSEEAATAWWRWAQRQSRTETELALHNVELPSPVDYEAIHNAAVEVLEAERSRSAQPVDLTFHLSPGTPAMAAVWLLLAKTRYDAHLVDSSREHGLRDVELPFEIAAEYVPTLLRDSDRHMARLTEAPAPDEPSFSDIVGRSEPMRRVLTQAAAAAPFSVPVLIEGESGTGKELLARAIHHASPRADGPFIPVNCGALPPDLVESTLFGHVKGAFTGADHTALGLFRSADGGTLLLDEIGELPPPAQVKLLRVLQEGEVTPVGSTTAHTVDVRIIAATNRVLIEETAAGRFRSDLYYRLAVAILTLPPLRDRQGDIGALIDHILEEINADNAHVHGWTPKRISAGARRILLNHHWPGNVRELMATLTRAAIWSTGATIRVEDVRSALQLHPHHTPERILDRPLDDDLDLPALLAQVATHYLTRAIHHTDGNKTKAATLLGLSNRQTLDNWLKKYGITTEK